MSRKYQATTHLLRKLPYCPESRKPSEYCFAGNHIKYSDVCTVRFPSGLSLITTKTSKMVAKSRMFSEILTRPSSTAGCWSANDARRSLTLRSWPTSCRMISKGVVVSGSVGASRRGKTSRTSLRVVAAPRNARNRPSKFAINMTPTSPSCVRSAWDSGSPRPRKRPSAVICTELSLGASDLANAKAREASARKPSSPTGAHSSRRSFS